MLGEKERKKCNSSDVGEFVLVSRTEHMVWGASKMEARTLLIPHVSNFCRPFSGSGLLCPGCPAVLRYTTIAGHIPCHQLTLYYLQPKYQQPVPTLEKNAASWVFIGPLPWGLGTGTRKSFPFALTLECNHWVWWDSPISRLKGIGMNTSRSDTTPSSTGLGLKGLGGSLGLVLPRGPFHPISLLKTP